MPASTAEKPLNLEVKHCIHCRGQGFQDRTVGNLGYGPESRYTCAYCKGSGKITSTRKVTNEDLLSEIFELKKLVQRLTAD